MFSSSNFLESKAETIGNPRDLVATLQVGYRQTVENEDSNGW
jgi:hypothetical protein